MSTFSKTLKQLRTEALMTQKELAQELNVSQNAVFNWENEKREPNLEMIEKISRFFNVKPAVLLGYDLTFAKPTNHLPEIRYDDGSEESNALKEKQIRALKNLIVQYKQARDNAKNEIDFLTVEVQDLDARIQEIEKRLQHLSPPDQSDPVDPDDSNR